MKIENPILPGFYPDPSICRKDEWYYIANSSFQWMPGIPIHRSRDLRHWEFVSHALTSPIQANLQRISDSYGIWAPDLTYADGKFWMVYTVVSRQNENICAETNYLITAEDPNGPWTQPVYLNSTGYDPGFFHDDDGRKYIVNMLHDDTPGADSFSGIILQEYDVEKQCLIGISVNIFKGTELGVTEGPHLYKRNDWYYLLTAEGGTLYGHAVTFARSRNITGPYELHPENPILTAKDKDTKLQKAGHADIIAVDGDKWAIVYLAARPVDKKCMLGRETCIQSLKWREDDWPYLDYDYPVDKVPDFGLPESPVKTKSEIDSFNQTELSPEWLTPRYPIGDWADLTSRPGYLRLHALPDSIVHIEETSFIARRIQHHSFRVETLMEYSPVQNFQHAGLICYYDCTHWFFLNKHFDSEKGTMLSLTVYDANRNQYERVAEELIDTTSNRIYLAVECDGREMQFFRRLSDNEDFIPIGPSLDALILSDDYVFQKQFAFTGAFVGLAAWDRYNLGSYADFDYFSYRAGLC